MGACFVYLGEGLKTSRLMGRSALCMMLTSLGEMNAVIMLAASYKYLVVNKKHRVSVTNHIHLTYSCVRTGIHSTKVSVIQSPSVFLCVPNLQIVNIGNNLTQ